MPYRDGFFTRHAHREAAGATLSLVQDGKPVYAVVVPDGNDAVTLSAATVLASLGSLECLPRGTVEHGGPAHVEHAFASITNTWGALASE